MILMVELKTYEIVFKPLHHFLKCITTILNKKRFQADRTEGITVNGEISNIFYFLGFCVRKLPMNDLLVILMLQNYNNQQCMMKKAITQKLKQYSTSTKNCRVKQFLNGKKSLVKDLLEEASESNIEIRKVSAFKMFALEDYERFKN